MTMYFQCELAQGSGRTRAYIEERGAYLGANVEIKDDKFEGFWTVTSVSNKGIEEKILTKQQKLNRNSFDSIAKRTDY